MTSPLDNVVFAPITRGDVSFGDHDASFADFAAHVVVDQAIRRALEEANNSPDGLPGPVIPSPGELPGPLGLRPCPGKSLGTIGIVGSGTAGLYAAMMLQSLDIKYEILESDGRFGGRIRTHRFNGQTGYDARIGTPARYDYFDVGAMRFPHIPFMDRVFDLFKRVRVENLFVTYKLSADNNLEYYNTRPPLNPTVQKVSGRDYFHVSVAYRGTVPNDFAKESPSYWTEKVFKHYKNLFAKVDQPGLSERQRNRYFREAWMELMKQDHHSTRSFMRAGLNGVPPYPETVVEWLETFQSGTGLFDEAFVEAVVSSLDFDWPWPLAGSPPKKQDTKWICFDGGSDHFVHNMVNQLKSRPKLGQRVKQISQNGRGEMEVIVEGSSRINKYDQVISTVPLGCLNDIDIDGCKLSYSQKQAIRALKYSASTKVGIKFEKRWWQDSAVMGGATIKGGQSGTDVPLRACVYPSYGLDCKDAPGILLASYSWAQDALRIGSIIPPDKASTNDMLLDVTLNQLEKLHGIPRAKFGKVLDYYAHSFYTDPHARGAFALFGPGQFGHPGEIRSLFASIKAPAANGKFHIAGEATSVHHGWVLGALNSAWRAVYNVLMGHPQLQKRFIDMWGIPDEDNEIHLQALHELALAGILL